MAVCGQPPSLIPIHRAYNRVGHRFYHTAPNPTSYRLSPWSRNVTSPTQDDALAWRLSPKRMEERASPAKANQKKTPPSRETSERPSPSKDLSRTSPSKLVTPRVSPAKEKQRPSPFQPDQSTKDTIPSVTSSRDKSKTPPQHRDRSRLSSPNDRPRQPPPQEKPKALPPELLLPRGSPPKDRPAVVRPPRLKSPSRRAEIGKSSLPISTKYSPPRDIVRSASAAETTHASRPRSNIPTRGEVIRSSIASDSGPPGLLSSPPPSSQPGLPLTLPHHAPPIHTHVPSEEDALNTARLRRNANEYLKVNQTKRPGTVPVASPASTQPHPNEAGGGGEGPESLDSEPRTFIVSRDSALPVLPPTNADQSDRASSASVDTSVNVGAEAAAQNSHNEEPKAVNNRRQTGPHNVEYVSDVRTLDSEATDPIVTPSSLLPEALDPIRGAEGNRGAEQSDLEVCQGSIPKVSMQLQNNNPKIPGDKICNLPKVSDTELHIADVELHIDEAADMDGRRLEDGKSRPLDPIYESLATASESRVIAEQQAVGRSTSEQAVGSPLRGQQQPGQSSAGRRRKYWPEDELCSPLTRQQRQAASKGLSLPAGRATTSLFDKSLSLGGYYQHPGDSQPGKLGYLKSSGRRLLQRLSSVRRSLRPKPDLPPPLPPDPSDEDRVFFRGFSAVSKGTYGVHSTDLVTSVYSPTAPPRKRRLRGARSRWDTSSLVGRSFSFNDAERIAAAVERGDSEQVEALYPDFPRSSPIYAVIDKSKKRRRNTSLECKEARPASAADSKEIRREYVEEIRASSCESERQTATENTLLTPGSSISSMVKSQSASNSPVTNKEFDSKNSSHSKLRKAKQKKLKGVTIENFNLEDSTSQGVASSLGNLSGPRSGGQSRVVAGSVQCVHSDGWQPLNTAPHRSVPLLVGDASQVSDQLRRERGSGLARVNGTERRKEETRGLERGLERGPPALQATAAGVGQSASEQARRRTLGNAKEADDEEEEVRIILAIADEHLDQAGSLLSSVRRDQRGAAAEEGSVALALDIENNIGRLEETREKIGNAIEIYKAVQERRGEVGGERSPPPPPRSPNVTFQATVNVEHKVRRDLKEVVITRTSRGRRSGVDDDRRDGQLWEPGQLGGGAPGLQPSSLNSLGEGEEGTHQKPWLASARRSRQDSADSSSSSPLTDRRQSAVWYDGDEDSSDCRSRRQKTRCTSQSFLSRQRKGTESEKCRNRVQELSRSFKKGKKTSGKKKRSSREESSVQGSSSRSNGSEETKEVGEIVADILAPMRLGLERGSTTMGNEISSAEEARPCLSSPSQPVSSSEQSRVMEVEGASSSSGSQSSSSFRTADSSNRTNSVSPVKRRDSKAPKVRSVSKLVAKFEQYDVTDGRGSVISSQSGSTDSGEQPEELRSSSSSLGRGDKLSQTQKQEKKTYLVAREIMTSEKVYVDVLRMIAEEFKEFVESKSRESGRELLPQNIFLKLFSNIPQLMMFNSELLKDFEDRIENWDSLKKIADVLVKKGPFLRLYATYLSDFEVTTNLFEECCGKYPAFGSVVREFESLPRCGNLKLKMHMLKPVQRLPQYKLLLEDYLKHQGENSIDFDDTTEALRIVSDAASAANNCMRTGDQFQKMLRLQSRVGDYELIQPSRELVKEGELMKISRNEVVPRYFILLSDCLLYTHYQGPWAGETTRLKVTYCLNLNQLSLSVPSNEEFQEEFSITSNVRSFTVRAGSVDDRNDWLEAINSAIEEQQNRQSTFNPAEDGVSSSTLSRVTLSPEESLGDVAPVWIPDQRVAHCQGCNVKFQLTVRRHHCRCCGGVMCSRCSANKAPIKYLQFERVRVCTACFEGLRKKYQHVPELQQRFKKKETSSPVTNYIPTRLREAADSQEVQMSGFLKWKRGKGAGWKKNWFVLKDRVLYTFKAVNDKVATDTRPVLGWTLETLSDKNFELYEGEPAGLVFLLTHPGQESIVFCSENDNLAEKWMTALREATCLEG